MQTQKQKEWYLKNRELTIQRAREWKKNNPEKLKKSGSNYYKKNKEILTQKTNEWKKKNSDKVYKHNLKYVTKNKERIAVWHKKWAIKNREKLRIQRAVYNEMNREHVREIFAKWSKRNPYRQYKKMGISLKTIEEASKKANEHCQLCGREARLVVDHCHEKLVFRGFLCQKCNLALGLFCDDIQLLEKAIIYLKHAS